MGLIYDRCGDRQIIMRQHIRHDDAEVHHYKDEDMYCYEDGYGHRYDVCCRNLSIPAFFMQVSISFAEVLLPIRVLIAKERTSAKVSNVSKQRPHDLDKKNKNRGAKTHFLRELL